MKAYERGYLRAGAEISADKDGDIFGQKRRYLPAKPHKGLTDKVHIVVLPERSGSSLRLLKKPPKNLTQFITSSLTLLNYYR